MGPKPMAGSPRYEAHLSAAGRDFVGGAGALCADVRIQTVAACRKVRGPLTAVGAREP